MNNPKKHGTHERRQSNPTIGKIEENTKLSKSEIDELREHFKAFDKGNTGSINRTDVIEVLKETGQFMSDSIKKRLYTELDNRGLRKVDFPAMIRIAEDVKSWEEEEDEEDINDDYVNAFIAMGGNPDRSGRVRKETIIDVIKTEFDLSFDIEEFLEKVGATQDELDFHAFCLLFEGGNDDARSLSRRDSFVSILSSRLRRKDSTASFTVRYKDFERFMEKVIY